MALLSNKAGRRSLRRMFERTLDTTADLYVEQQDGSGGVETVLDQEAVPCRRRPVSAQAGEAAEHAGQNADRRRFFVFFKHDADVTEQHEVEIQDVTGQTSRLRVETIQGKEPHSTHIRALCKKVDS